MAHPDSLQNKLAFFKVTVVIGLLIIWLCGCIGRYKPLTSEPTHAPPEEVAHVPVSHTAATKLPDIRFTIQVGAFSTPDRAAHYMDTMQAAGLDAYYFIDTDGLAKVRFERFDTRKAAYQRARTLRTLGIIQEYCIVPPRPESDIAKRTDVDPRIVLQKGLVNTAIRFIGTPYRWGGSSRRDGFDCSGLTMTVYRLNGLELPRNTRAQYRAGKPVARDMLRKGDLVFFATNGGKLVSHVGIYSGEGRFIHAPGRGKYIRSASLSNTYFGSRYLGARRYY